MDEPCRRPLSVWWTGSLFPAPAAGPSPASPRFLAALAAVTALAALLLMLRLSCPLREPDEALAAESARRLLACPATEHVTPHGAVLAGSLRLLGVSDRAARLPSAVAGVLLVLVTGLWGRCLFGPRPALLAALILTLSARFLFLARLVTPDGLAALAALPALAGAHAAVTRPSLARWPWAASAALAALGGLAGGLAVPACVLLTAATYTRLDRRTARPSPLAWAAGAAGAVLPVAVIAPHSLAVAPAGAARVLPALAALATGLLPWTLLAPLLVRTLVRTSRRAAAERPPALGFLLLALASVLLSSLVLGGPACRRLLTALPLVSLALALPLNRLLVSAPSVSRAAATALACRATQAALGGAALVAVAAGFTGLIEPAPAAAVTGAAALAALGLDGPLRRQTPGAAWAACGLVSFLVLAALTYTVLPGYHRRSALRGQARAAVTADAGLPVVCYPRPFPSLAFYLGRDDIRAYSPAEKGQLLDALRDQSATLVFVESGPALDDLLADLPPGMEFLRHGREGLVTAGTVRYRPEPPAHLMACVR